MFPAAPHLVLDLIATAMALSATWLVYRTRLRQAAGPLPDDLGPGYAVALVAGAVIGGFGFGTLNLVLTGIPGLGRSILGALAGAIAGVELFKASKGVRGSTGLIFVPGFCITVAVGRIGCFLSGLDDQTHGIPADLPWAHDFGDGIPRHPVQLYETLAMALFLLVAAAAIWRRSPFFMRNGFYLMAGFYAAQRFLWEFLKPYATVVGPLNLFHLLGAGLLVYAGVMIVKNRNVPA